MNSMRYKLILLSFLFTACNYDVHVSGIILDGTTGRPVAGVMVRTIKDLNNSRLEYATTTSASDGRFELVFSPNSPRTNEIAVELSKKGYRSNMYKCYQDRPGDTLYLQRDLNR